MKTKILSFKAAFVAAFLLLSYLAPAQNLVKNGSLENGEPPCYKNGVWNNGPFYLGENLVDDWYGLNYGASSSNHPVMSGSIFHNNAGCSPGLFPSGVSAYAGNRSAQVYASYSSGVIWANWARGNLTTTLGEGCYWVCIATNNHGTNTTSGIVEVLLESSTTGHQAMILRYIIPANSGWLKKKGYFKLLPSEAGKYDRILIRTDNGYLQAYSTSTEHVNNIIFDDVSIAACTSDPDLAVAEAGFSYEVAMEAVEGGSAPIISGTAQDNGELYIHRWDIYTSTDQHAADAEWVHMSDNSGTVLEEAGFSSGTLELATQDRYYRLIHLVVNPCYGWALEGKLIAVRADGAVEDLGDIVVDNPVWSPSGDEFDEPEMRGQTGTGVDTEPMMYTIYPNPPVNEITIVPAETNTDQPVRPTACEVYDIRGVVVIKSTDLTVNNTVNISALPTGVYYVKIFTGDKVEVQRFLKK